MWCKLYSFYGQKESEVDQPSNSFLTLLNGIRIFSSSVLGALYTLAQKEKSNDVATIEIVSLYALLWFLETGKMYVIAFEECLSLKKSYSKRGKWGSILLLLLFKDKKWVVIFHLIWLNVFSSINHFRVFVY